MTGNGKPVDTRGFARKALISSVDARVRTLKPVTIVTVTYDTFFFLRLLVEKVRGFISGRTYEIIAVDRVVVMGRSSCEAFNLMCGLFLLRKRRLDF